MRSAIHVVSPNPLARRMMRRCVWGCVWAWAGVLCLAGAGCREMTLIASGLDEMVTGRKDYGSMIQRSDAREDAGDGPLAKEVEELSVEYECRYFISAAGLIRRADSGNAAAKRDLALYEFDHAPGLDPFRLRMLEEASAAGDPIAKRALAMTMLPETKAPGAISTIAPPSKLPLVPNPERGLSLMKEAAEAGDAWAALCLAEHVEPASAEHWLGVGLTRWVEITSYDSDGDVDYDATSSNIQSASYCGSKLSRLAPTRRAELNSHFERLASKKADVKSDQARQRERWAREAERAEAARAEHQQEMRELTAALRGTAAEMDAENKRTMDGLLRQGYGGGAGGSGGGGSRDPEPGVSKTVTYEKGKEPRVEVDRPIPPGSTVTYEKGKEPRVETPEAAGGGLKPQSNTPGQKNGWERTYFDDGRVRTETYYVNGKRNGEYREYVIASMNEARVVIRDHYFLHRSGRFEDDQRAGEWQMWWTDMYLDRPFLQETAPYFRGKLNGKKTRWYTVALCGGSNGTPYVGVEEEYADGRLSGERREYEWNCSPPMTRITRSTMYLNGKKNGPQIEYRNGVPFKTTNYIDGEKIGG